MKHMKRLVSLITAFLMVFGLALNVTAAEGDGADSDPTTTITVENAVAGANYTALKLFDVTKDENDLDAVSYSISNALKEAIDNIDKTATTKAPFKFTTSDNVTWYVIPEEGETKVDTKKMASWVKDNLTALETAFASQKYTAQAPERVEGSTEPINVTIPVETTGYYAVYPNKTADGQTALIMIDTLYEDAKIVEKNDDGFDKEAPEQNGFAGVGDVVPFEVTGKLYQGLKQYVVRDTMTAITLDTTNFKVYVDNNPITDVKNLTPLTEDVEYTFTPNTATSDPYATSFTFAFKETYLDTITSTKYVKIFYQGTIHESAINETNLATNTATLTYGNGSDTTTREDTVELYNYSLNIYKFANENNTKKALEGAEFNLYKKGENGEFTKVPLIKETNGTFRVAKVGEAATSDPVVTGTDGYAYINGLDRNSEYILKETKAPAGYNVTNADLNIVFTAETDKTHSVTLEVLNNKGSQLPSTGGMGTTMLYIAGGILVLGAGILLITRRRMSSEN